MDVLSCGEESMTIRLAVLIYSASVWQTDGRPAYIYYVLQQYYAFDS